MAKAPRSLSRVTGEKVSHLGLCVDVATVNVDIAIVGPGDLATRLQDPVPRPSCRNCGRMANFFVERNLHGSREFQERSW